MFILLSRWAYCKLLLKMFWYEHWTRFPMQMNTKWTNDLEYSFVLFFMRPINENARHENHFLCDNILLSISSIKMVSSMVSLMAKWNYCFDFTLRVCGAFGCHTVHKKTFYSSTTICAMCIWTLSDYAGFIIRRKRYYFSRNFIISFRISDVQMFCMLTVSAVCMFSTTQTQITT